jgi:F-type H+-transporting ATPase subunit alpha
LQVAVGILGDADRVISKTVTFKADAFTFPVGPSLAGRVVDVLGRPYATLEDGDLGALGSDTLEAKCFCPAPSVLSRGLITSRILSGIKAIDAFRPIGQGQRFSIHGVQGTGKTRIALDTVINQMEAKAVRGEELHCVYVICGKTERAASEIIYHLRVSGALENTTVVMANNSNSMLTYLSPYAGMAVGEWHRDNGRHALVVLDELETHAEAYNLVGENLKHPTASANALGLYAPLLERASKLSGAKGGGSMTALVLCGHKEAEEPAAGEIASQLVGMTDDSLQLNPRLANKGVYPPLETLQLVGGSRAGHLLPRALLLLVQQLKIRLAEGAFTARGAKVATQLGLEHEYEVMNAVQEHNHLQSLWIQPIKTCHSFAHTFMLAYAGVHTDLLSSEDENAVDHFEQRLALALAEDPELRSALEEAADLHASAPKPQRGGVLGAQFPKRFPEADAVLAAAEPVPPSEPDVMT